MAGAENGEDGGQPVPDAPVPGEEQTSCGLDTRAEEALSGSISRDRLPEK